MSRDNPVKRNAIRFNPDLGTLAQIDLELTRDDGSFRPTLLGLVSDESSKGAGIVLLATEKLQEKSECRIQVGRLPPMRAEIRWRRELDLQVVRVGLLFLE